MRKHFQIAYPIKRATRKFNVPHFRPRDFRPGFNQRFRVLFFQLAVVLLVLSGLPVPAYAHLTNTGFGPFYDGLAHLFLSPADLMHVIALALLAGLRGPYCGRVILFVLPPAWLAGIFFGFLLAAQATIPMAATALITFTLGVLVAVNRPFPPAVVGGIVVIVGLFDGARNGIDLSHVASNFLVTAGIVCALFIFVSLFTGQVTKIRAFWAQVSVRVAGSWIAAAGLFMLGWAARGIN